MNVAHLEADTLDVGLECVDVETVDVGCGVEQDVVRLVISDDRCRDQGRDLTHIALEARLEVREVHPVHERHGTDVESRLPFAVGVLAQHVARRILAG